MKTEFTLNPFLATFILIVLCSAFGYMCTHESFSSRNNLYKYPDYHQHQSDIDTVYIYTHY